MLPMNEVQLDVSAFQTGETVEVSLRIPIPACESTVVPVSIRRTPH